MEQSENSCKSDHDHVFYLAGAGDHFYELGTLIREYRPLSRLLDRRVEGAEGIVLSAKGQRAVRFLADGTCAKSSHIENPFENYIGDRQKNLEKCAIAGTFDETLPWGILTGVRPSKVAYAYLDQGLCPEQIERILEEAYLLRKDKAALVVQVASFEHQMLADHSGDDISLYVGIPFCPTRCLYCSFISNDQRAFERYADDYLLALKREISEIMPLLKGHRIRSLYVGGGTPTMLSARQLSTLTETIQQYVPFKSLEEVSVEAGRPDTILTEKLEVLKEAGVKRISINPQTMNQKTLDAIGRRHTVEQVYEAFDRARRVGFDTINMDLIMGLPGEDEKDVEKTLQAVRLLAPENLTVHTLAVKRSSRLHETGEGQRLLTEDPRQQYERVDAMLKAARETAQEMGLAPYYMYRQKNMAGNFENVGYSLPGHEGRYNIEIMEEKQTILAFGAGGVSKIYEPPVDRISRVPNMKNAKEYIERIDEMIQRKKTAIGLLTGS